MYLFRNGKSCQKEISIHKIRLQAYTFEFQMNAMTTLWFFAISEDLECKLWPPCHSY